MSIILTGVSHKTAPVEVRERLALARDEGGECLRRLVDGETIREPLVVSTCNRVEVVAHAAPRRAGEAAERVAGFLAGASALDRVALARHLYKRDDYEAVRHVFRVASSLDSMVLGEPQILGQVRQAYARACEAGTAGRVLHRLMHHAFHTAKRVRSETGIASSAVSVSYAAVELGRKILGTLEGRTILLVGAGEMAELAARHLSKAGAGRILVANRTHETAERLAAEFGGETVAFERLDAHLAEADVVLCSTGAREYVVTAEAARAAQVARRNRPTFFVDISVPRNVDPAVAGVSNLFVFDVDDLEAVVASNLRERGREAERAELIVEAEARHFEEQLRGLDTGRQIGAFRRELQELARAEFERRRRQLGDLTPEQERAVEALLLSATNKIAHPVIELMRRGAAAEQEVWPRPAETPLAARRQPEQPAAEGARDVELRAAAAAGLMVAA
ncbi:MAG TPA: glutamyl-tRNA reductase [Pyrinomonadaceae bacterium]|nr:glutamyl-tRNA reductase [Pyrinomonadaceae bacterium]